MNAAKKINTPVEVLARLDTHTRQPVVFLRSTIDSKGGVTIWRNGAEEKSTVDFYGTTAPLNTKDEQVMRKRFADAYGIAEADVIINKRLPRTPRERPSMLKNLPAPTAAAQQAAPLPSVPGITPEALAALVAAIPQLQTLIPAMMPAATPAAEQPATATPATTGNAPALTLVHDASAPPASAATNKEQETPAADAAAASAPAEQEQPATRKRMTKREKARLRSEAAKKGAATRAAKRSGNAKPLDDQPAPPPVHGDLPQPGEQPAPLPPKEGRAPVADAPAVVQATPAEVVDAILEIRQRFNAELESVLQKLTPQK